MDQIVAEKNKKAYISDIAKIVAVILLSAVLILIVLIFRKSMPFISGKYSPLDFILLFLLLTVRLTVNGVEYLRKHKRMLRVMLSLYNGELKIFGEEVFLGNISQLNGAFEFGKTGTIILTTQKRTYTLYGVKGYASVINALEKQIVESRNKK